MSIRWRLNGDMLCAAMTEAEPDDCYIDDRLHYRLSVETQIILPALDEEQTGRWYWTCEYTCRDLRAVEKES